MATTNWDTADIFQNECPHTFNSLQHLVMSMAKVFNNRGKKSIFGKDKGLAAYKAFEEKLRDTVLAMVLDGIIQRNSPAGDVRENLEPPWDVVDLLTNFLREFIPASCLIPD